jgi:hypothetical protein
MTVPVVYYSSRNAWILTSFVICAVFMVVIFFFGGWHWHLAIKGRTTIEYFSTNLNFSAGNWRKNLEIVFGTWNFWRILAPCSKVLVYDGINWPDSLQGV